VLDDRDLRPVGEACESSADERDENELDEDDECKCAAHSITSFRS